MTWEDNQWFFDSLLSWWESANQTLGKVWDHIVNAISGAFTNVRNAFMTTIPWKICQFIWDILSFLFYWVRSIILLIRNTLTSILNWFIEMFSWLLWTFTDLSYFMWSTTSLLISMFICVMLIITFGFIFRFFTDTFLIL